MDSRNVDVNVTPDKLQMFFKHENALMATLKSSLMKIYNKSNKNLNLDESSFHSPMSSKDINSFFNKSSTSNGIQSKLLHIEDAEEVHRPVVSEKIEKCKTRDEKRTREVEVELISEEPPVPKQPKLAMYQTSSEHFDLIPMPKKQTAVLPVKNFNSDKDSSQPTPFSKADHLNFFQNRIGSNTRIDSLKTANDLNDSLTEKINLHLCNRETGILDTPPPAVAKHKTVESLTSLESKRNVKSNVLNRYEQKENYPIGESTIIEGNLEYQSP